MAFYPVNFQPLGQEANPLSSMNMAQEMLKQQIQNQFMPQEMMSEIQKNQLANQLSQIKMPYAGPQAAAELAAAQAQPGLIGAQTGDEWAKAKLANAQAQWEPTTAQAAYLGGLGKLQQANYLNNPTTAFTRVINNPAAEALIGSNKTVGTNATNAMNSIISRAAPNTGYSPLSVSFNNGVPALSGGTQSPMQQGSASQNPISPQDIANVQDAANSSVVRKTTTAQIMNQRLFDQSAQNMMDQVSQSLPNILKFTGAQGTAGLWKNRIAGMMNMATDPGYQDYYNFTHVQVPAVANEIRRQLGGNATIEETKLMTSLTDPLTWDSNPQLAASQWNQLINTTKANRRALVQSQGQLVKTMQSQNAADSENQNNSSSLVRVQAPDGTVLKVPSNTVDQMLKDHPDHKRIG